MARRVQVADAITLCQAGLASEAEHPEPVPPLELCQTDSLQPRAADERVRCVPPTATTRGELAG